MKENAAVNKISRSLTVSCLTIASLGAQAMAVSYTAIDLADTSPGEDLWAYRYQVTDASFASGEGFTLFFDPALYGMVEFSPPPVNGDWDILTTQPSTAVPAPGMYDALALVDSPSLAQPFQVAFTWLGSGVPGAQDYVRYDAGFTTIASGTTVPTVPEPGTWALMLTALGLMGLGSAWRRVAASCER